MPETSNRRKERIVLIMLFCMLVILIGFFGGFYSRRTASLRISRLGKIESSLGSYKLERSLSVRRRIWHGYSRIVSFLSGWLVSGWAIHVRMSCSSVFRTIFSGSGRWVTVGTLLRRDTASVATLRVRDDRRDVGRYLCDG